MYTFFTTQEYLPDLTRTGPEYPTRGVSSYPTRGVLSYPTRGVPERVTRGVLKEVTRGVFSHPSEALLEAADEFVRFVHAETERRQQADDVCPARTGEHVLFEDEAAA